MCIDNNCTISTTVHAVEFSKCDATKNQSLFRSFVSFFCVSFVLRAKKAGLKPKSHLLCLNLAISMFNANQVNRRKKEKHDKQMTFQRKRSNFTHNCTSKWCLHTQFSIRRFTCLCSDPVFDIINCYWNYLSRGVFETQQNASNTKIETKVYRSIACRMCSLACLH